MPSLDSAAAQPFAKIMLIGPSKVGKTTALACLARAGYHLHILDMDCKIPGSYLHTILRDDPAALGRVSFMQFRDTFDASGKPTGTPGKTAYDDARKTLDKWEDGTKPSEWGPQHVYVVDTLNLLSTAAFNNARILNPNYKEERLFYKASQNAINGFMGSLWSSNFKTNVIVNSHIKEIAMDRKYIDAGNGKTELQAVAGSPIKQFPATIGEALSREVAVYTNELYRIERTGQGTVEKRVIVTKSDGKMDMGSGLRLPPTLPAEDGLLTIFKELTK